MEFLDNKISIYVPSTYNVNNEINNRIYVIYVMKELSNIFGGATEIQANGCYLSNNGELIEEKINIIYSYCSKEQLEENMNKIIAICELLKNDMQQECISLEINNKLTFI